MLPYGGEMGLSMRKAACGRLSRKRNSLAAEQGRINKQLKELAKNPDAVKSGKLKERLGEVKTEIDNILKELPF